MTWSGSILRLKKSRVIFQGCKEDASMELKKFQKAVIADLADYLDLSTSLFRADPWKMMSMFQQGTMD